MPNYSIERLERVTDKDYTAVTSDQLASVMEAEGVCLQGGWRKWSAQHSIPHQIVYDILTRKYRTTALDMADKILLALRKNVSQTMVVIPNHQKVSARKMALDEFRAQEIDATAEMVEQRAIELETLRQDVLERIDKATKP